MTPETLEALRFLANAGDRDAQLIVRAGDVADLIDELDAQAIVLNAEMRFLSVARTIARHWKEQEGVNGALLDQLAQLSEPE